MSTYKYLDASALKGERIKSVAQISDDEIQFACDSGKVFRMYHSQDFCESVRIHDIKGNLQDLVGFTITEAKEETSPDRPADAENPEYVDESCTWTTYTFETLAIGKVVIRWYGSSNGYYSESVQIDEITASQPAN